MNKKELMGELDRMRTMLTALEHDSEKLHSEIRSLSVDFDNLPTHEDEITDEPDILPR